MAVRNDEVVRREVIRVANHFRCSGELLVVIYIGKLLSPGDKVHCMQDDSTYNPAMPVETACTAKQVRL